MFDYRNELCDNLEIVAICRVTEGQCGETVCIKWNLCLSCVKRFRIYMFYRMQFIITYISLEDFSNNFYLRKL